MRTPELSIEETDMNKPEEEEHIQRLEWKLRDLGAEHARIYKMLNEAVAREVELRAEIEDQRELARIILYDLAECETVEFARMHARGAIEQYFKKEKEKERE
jgi:hypothetical protein